MSQAANRSARVLLVDDDRRLTVALAKSLSLHGYDVFSACDAGQALASLDIETPDLIVLDVMMPGLDGLRLCQLISGRVDVPILMLTALDSVPDRIAGLEAGADDYLVKPFATDELLARIAALLRRARKEKAPTTLSFGDILLDRRAWRVERCGEQLSLTAKEFRILEAFMRAPGRVLSREEILATAWNYEGAESNVVDVHVSSLRQKLEAAGGTRLIQTVRGVGYVLRNSE